MKKIYPTIIVLLSTISIATSQEINLHKDTNDSTNLINLEDVLILSSQVKNKHRQAVVVSTIDAKKIQLKLGNQELPEIMKSTPSIYATKMGGGYGDSRVSLRGFGSENISFLVNGIPVNGMENGAMYWSNWSGLSDIAQSIQIQRGIGASKLGVFSVGGTINIVTIGAQSQKGAWVEYGVGNDGYQKMGFSLSTGQSKNGWALSLMGGRTTGNGYVLGTEFESWNYFVSLSKYFNSKHSISFTVFGAPQWHNKRGNKQTIEDYENNPNGIRMNTSYGYLNGKILPSYGGYNTYHKPQLTLNHYWTISDKTKITTSLYASLATGGGRKVYGDKASANRIQYDYQTGKPIYDKGVLVTNLTLDGLIDYNPIMRDNATSETGSKAVFTMGTNSHNWYGLISNLTQSLGDRFILTAGLDVRYYKGFHFDEIENLLGGSHFIDNSLAWRTPDTKLRVGDRVSRDDFSEILCMGAFAQLEYRVGKLQAFVSGSIADHQYRRTDNGKYGAYSDQEKFPSSAYRTPWTTFMPINIKAGVNYRLTENHRFFANGGYITKAPALENIYTNNDYVGNATNEKILTAEVGYGYADSKLSIQANAYVTSWKDKSVTKAIGSWNGPRAAIPNLDALHKGIEIEVSYAPIPTLRLDGFLSYGDWKWVDDIQFKYVNDRNEVIGEYNAYIDGLFVGNAPQTSGYIGATWLCLDGLTIGADVNYYARHYADFSAIDRTNKEDRGQSWKLPDYSTVDLNLSYQMNFNKFSILFFGNVFNLLNTKYISDAVDNVIQPSKGETGHGSKNAVVWYGFGTTWNAGIRVKF